MDFQFPDLIHALTKIPLEELEEFATSLTIVELKKGERFVQAGQFPKRIGFIKKGLFRYFYTHPNGTEFTKAFFDQGTSISAYSALIEQRSSYFSIQALEDSVVETIDYVDILKLYETDPRWKQFEYALLRRGYLIKEEREREFLLFDAEARYATFQTRFPGLEARVRQHMIASYLGITPETLSRIRKKHKPLT